MSNYPESQSPMLKGKKKSLGGGSPDSPTRTDRAHTSMMVSRKFEDNINRGNLPNNLPIELHVVTGETIPKNFMPTSKLSQRSSIMGTSRQGTSRISRNRAKAKSTLGYDAVYENPNYHIVNHRGMHNQHELSVLPNDPVIKPYKEMITKTIGFEQYSDRQPINFD